MEALINNLVKRSYLKMERNGLTQLMNFVFKMLNQLLSKISPQQKNNLLTNDVLSLLPHCQQVAILNKLNK